MSCTTERTNLSTVARLRSAWVVTSPATTTRSVVTSVSQATRLSGSALRQWSSTASLIWSATLSGCPIDTDSLVNRYRSALTSTILVQGLGKLAPVASVPRDYRSTGWTVATATGPLAALRSRQAGRGAGERPYARAAAAHQCRRPDAALAGARPAPAGAGRGRLAAAAARGGARRHLHGPGRPANRPDGRAPRHRR